MAHVVTNPAAATADCRVALPMNKARRRAGNTTPRRRSLACMTRRSERSATTCRSWHSALLYAQTRLFRFAVDLFMQLVTQSVLYNKTTQQIEARLSGVWVLAVTWRLSHQSRCRTAHLVGINMAAARRRMRLPLYLLSQTDRGIFEPVQYQSDLSHCTRRFTQFSVFYERIEHFSTD